MQVEDSKVLDAIEKEINRISEENQKVLPKLEDAVRPVRKNVTLADIDSEQSYTPFDYEEFRISADEVGLEEPIDELLEALGD